MTPEQAANHFDIQGHLSSLVPYGSGHINDTYRMQWVKGDQEADYILQRINLSVFSNGKQLIQNVHHICSHLKQALTKDPAVDLGREILQGVPTREGHASMCDENQHLWRCFHYITDSYTLQVCRTDDDAYQAAHAFGRFLHLLSDLPPSTIQETIPRFHDTPHRLDTLNKAIQQDEVHRLNQVENELHFVNEHHRLAPYLVDSLAQGSLPLRVTHNDTKLNNVLFDQHTDKSLCVIDLDTCMPGAVAYDFGDMARTMSTNSREDTADLTEVFFLPTRFAALEEGFCDGSQNTLTEAERKSFVIGARLLMFTIGIRFLTDYLLGDVYFKTTHATHNLERCRTQFKLMGDMEKQWALSPDKV